MKVFSAHIYTLQIKRSWPIVTYSESVRDSRASTEKKRFEWLPNTNCNIAVCLPKNKGINYFHCFFSYADMKYNDDRMKFTQALREFKWMNAKQNETEYRNNVFVRPAFHYWQILQMFADKNCIWKNKKRIHSKSRLHMQFLFSNRIQRANHEVWHFPFLWPEMEKGCLVFTWIKTHLQLLNLS